MSDPTPLPDDPTKHPVLSYGWVLAVINGAIFTAFAILSAFEVWTPTAQQSAAIFAAAAFLVTSLYPLGAYFLSKKTTPTANVALTKTQLRELNAAGVTGPTAAPEPLYSRGPDGPAGMFPPGVEGPT